MFDEDSQPCQCSCGEWFDLNDGNPCSGCKTIFCEECVVEAWEKCPSCTENDKIFGE